MPADKHEEISQESALPSLKSDSAVAEINTGREELNKRDAEAMKEQKNPNRAMSRTSEVFGRSADILAVSKDSALEHPQTYPEKQLSKDMDLPSDSKAKFEKEIELNRPVNVREVDFINQSRPLDQNEVNMRDRPSPKSTEAGGMKPSPELSATGADKVNPTELSRSGSGKPGSPEMSGADAKPASSETPGDTKISPEIPGASMKPSVSDLPSGAAKPSSHEVSGPGTVSDKPFPKLPGSDLPSDVNARSGSDTRPESVKQAESKLAEEILRTGKIPEDLKKILASKDSDPNGVSIDKINQILAQRGSDLRLDRQPGIGDLKDQVSLLGKNGAVDRCELPEPEKGKPTDEQSLQRSREEAEKKIADDILKTGKIPPELLGGSDGPGLAVRIEEINRRLAETGSTQRLELGKSKEGWNTITLSEDGIPQEKWVSIPSTEFGTLYCPVLVREPAQGGGSADSGLGGSPNTSRPEVSADDDSGRSSIPGASDY